MLMLKLPIHEHNKKISKGFSYNTYGNYKTVKYFFMSIVLPSDFLEQYMQVLYYKKEQGIINKLDSMGVKLY